MESKVIKLEAAIKYREGDLHNARILVEQFEPDDPDAEVNLACIDFKVFFNCTIKIIFFIFRKANI